jgi:anaerobic selenocysteine-containing dehydrogenase
MDHGGCALRVAVENNRITAVRGNLDGHLNQGFCCPRAKAAPQKLDHPQRLRQPLHRKGRRGAGSWQTISWQAALDLIAENLLKVKRDSGARSVAFCQGMPKGLEHFVLIRLANCFGSPNVVATQDVCHAPREITGLHTCGFYPVADFHHPSRLAVIWASNPTVTNEEGLVGRLLLKQVQGGTDLMVVDPRKTPLAARAKYWLPIRPGTDHALALAFLNVIVDQKLYPSDFVKQWTIGFSDLAAHVRQYPPEKMASVTGVPAALIRSSAVAYAKASPAVIAWGNPIEQTVNAFDTARALICLMAICGNLDIPGGNIKPVDPPVVSLGKFVRADLLPSKRHTMLHAHHGSIPRLMTVPPAYFRQAVLEKTPYPVKAAYVQCANPVLAYADSRRTVDALNRLDFLAVADIFMTPTATLADVVLPAATHFEFNDIGHYGLGHGIVLARPKLVDPPRDCRPDIQVLNDLGRRLSPPDLWFEDYEQLLDLVLAPAGIDYRRFCEIGALRGKDRFRKYIAAGFETRSGKVELKLTQAASFGLPALPEYNELPEAPDNGYPLVLTSFKSPNYLHSSYRWLEALRKREPYPEAWIHPLTARRFGLREGDPVVIETRNGSVSQRAHLTAAVRQDVVMASYGWWLPENLPHSGLEWKTANFNLLTSANPLGKAFGTPNLKGIGCRIRKLVRTCEAYRKSHRVP